MEELHVKHRPETYEEVVGQDLVCESVEEALKRGRGRAFIFTGPSGVGKTTIARIMASQLGAEGSDLLEIDAATRTGIESVRELQEAIRFRALSGGNRVLILDEAHMLTKGAWNALLKVIEEPPKGVYWILCTTDPTKIPDTISTRCICYDLKPISIEGILDVLEKIVDAEELETPEDVIYLCAEKAEGSPRRGITMLSKVADCDDRKEAALLLQHVSEKKEAVDLCRSIIKGQGLIPCIKLVKKLEGNPVEGIRQVILGYFTKVAMDAKTEGPAGDAIRVLECFKDSYPTGTSMAPLLVSLSELLLEDYHE